MFEVFPHEIQQIEQISTLIETTSPSTPAFIVLYLKRKSASVSKRIKC